MKESAWYKVRSLRIVEKDEAPLFIGRRLSRKWGNIRFAAVSFHYGGRVPSISLAPIGWRQYKPTRFFGHLIRKTFGWLFFYLIEFIESKSSVSGLGVCRTFRSSYVKTPGITNPN
jgi:hypothetical protein